MAAIAGAAAIKANPGSAGHPSSPGSINAKPFASNPASEKTSGQTSSPTPAE
jgi:hypothetical protein